MSRETDKRKADLRVYFQPLFDEIEACGIRLRTPDNSKPKPGDQVFIDWNIRGIAAGSSSKLAALFAETSLGMWKHVQTDFQRNQDQAKAGERLSPVDSYDLAARSVQQEMCDLVLHAAGPAAAAEAIRVASETENPANMRSLFVRLIRLMIRSGTPNENAQKLIECDKQLFDFSDSVSAKTRAEWEARYVQFRGAGFSTNDDKRDIGQALAGCLQTAAARSIADAPLSRICAQIVNKIEWEVYDFDHCGEETGKSIGRWGIKGGKLPIETLNALGIDFSIGAMNSFKHESVTGGAFYSYLRDQLKKSQADLTSQLISQSDFDQTASRIVAGMWLLLDKKRIEQFRADFPDLSDAYLEAAINSKIRYDYLASLRLEDALEDKSSLWARKAFPNEDDGSAEPSATPKAPLGQRFSAALSILQALELKEASKSQPGAAAGASKKKSAKSKGKSL